MKNLDVSGGVVPIELTARDLAQITLALAYYGSALASPDAEQVILEELRKEPDSQARVQITLIRDLARKIERAMLARGS